MFPRASIGVAALALAGAVVLFAQQPHPRDTLAELSGSIRELTRRVSPAVVEILVTGYGLSDDDGRISNQISRQRSSGSGVIVDPAGYIMTNAHVVQGATAVEVLVNTDAASGAPRFQYPRTLPARVLGVDRDTDLALLRIDEKELPSLQFADSDAVSQGDLVLAVGSPLQLRNSLSMGVVSAPARGVTEDDPILYIQTDASINPGDSGGALVNTDGMLVGLSTFIVSKSGGSEGIGFAIPSDIVQSVYGQLRRSGVVSRGTLGVDVENITEPLAKGLDLPLRQGVMVSNLDRDGPGAAAGLQRRDVILRLDDKPVATARQFEEAVYRREAGEKVALDIQRGSERLSMAVTLTTHRAKADSLYSLIAPEKNIVPRLGIFCVEIDERVEELIPGLRKGYGLLVAAKSPEGQAQFLNLQPGDVIHAVNNLPIALLDTFRAKIAGFRRGDAVALEIERDGRYRYVAFEMD